LHPTVNFINILVNHLQNFSILVCQY